MRQFDKHSPFSSFNRICCFLNLSVFTIGSTLVCKRNFVLICLLTIFSNSAFALKDRTFCVWDPVGRTGPVMTFYSDVIPKAQAWGLNLKFVAYTEETDAVKEFKAGKCEAVVLTSILSRQFVQFAGTMDAIGAINSQEGLELALKHIPNIIIFIN